MSPEAPSPLARAASDGDAAAVKRWLADGAAADGAPGEADAPLFAACAGNAPAAARLACATLLLDAGASPRRGNSRNRTALHAAAARGPLALVELLIARGAFAWQTDAAGMTALDAARAGNAHDRHAIVELLDRPVIRDPRFRDAVQALHRGDVAALARLLDAHPDLLHVHAIEPDCYPRDYFRDPKLFWFVANNPILVSTMPRNIVDIVEAMLRRGVDKADIDYAFELVISGSAAREQGLQVPLLLALVDAGATLTPRSIDVALAHRETAPIEALLARGIALDAPMAAGLGRGEDLARLLPSASAAERQRALGLAVINGHADAARLCIDAGADVNSLLPVHAHSTPLHQAAVNDDIPMLALLLARGARIDTRDTLWNGTPLGWAIHNRKTKAEALLRAHVAGIRPPA